MIREPPYGVPLSSILERTHLSTPEALDCGDPLATLRGRHPLVGSTQEDLKEGEWKRVIDRRKRVGVCGEWREHDRVCQNGAKMGQNGAKMGRKASRVLRLTRLGATTLSTLEMGDLW